MPTASRPVPADKPRSPTVAPPPMAKQPAVEPPSGPPQVRAEAAGLNGLVGNNLGGLPTIRAWW